MNIPNTLLATMILFGLPSAMAQAPDVDLHLPRVFVVGDSTASNAGGRGWGDPFRDYFDITKINVVNAARAGRSSRTFQTEGLWDRVMSDLKSGDFVLIQFGHNDGGPPDKDRACGSLPGIGDESKEFTLPNGNKEVVHTFGWYLRKYIADTKAKGATPIVLSLTVRNIWKDGKVERGPGSFGNWSAATAAADHVAFIDVTNIIANRYEAMGQQKVKDLFPQDHTHTSPIGADLNAASVIAGLKGLKDLPLLGSLSAKGQAAPASAHEPPQAGLFSPRPMPEPANPKLPTLFLIGDSTVRNGRGDGSNGQWGWGEPFAGFFDSTKINVVNRAVGGLSSRTFLTFGHWERVMTIMKPGDFAIMQFGHNDNGPLDDVSRARGTIKGSGEEAQEIDNPITKKHEVVHSYGWYLRKYVTDARAQGATPMICSLVPRKIWKNGKIARNSEDYGKWAADVAKQERVPLLDLNEIVARRYDELGPEKVEPLFADPHTHTSRAGAELNAASVIVALKGLKNNPLAPYFSDKAAALPAALATSTANAYVGPNMFDRKTIHF